MGNGRKDLVQAQDSAQVEACRSGVLYVVNVVGKNGTVLSEIAFNSQTGCLGANTVQVSISSFVPDTSEGLAAAIHDAVHMQELWLKSAHVAIVRSTLVRLFGKNSIKKFAVQRTILFFLFVDALELPNWKRSGRQGICSEQFSRNR